MAWDEAKKRKMLKAWWGMTAGQFSPKAEANLNEEKKTSQTRLFNRFRQLPDGAELADLFLRITELQYAFAFYRGFRRGYNVRRGLEKLGRRSPEDDAKAKIADLCIKHPDWSTKRIFGALDDEKVRLIFLGRTHQIRDRIQQKQKRKDKPEFWWEVAGDSAYKMLVSRIRDKVQKDSRLRGWEKIMKRHTKLRKQ